jgi:hypothetical protein
MKLEVLKIAKNLSNKDLLYLAFMVAIRGEANSISNTENLKNADKLNSIIPIDYDDAVSFFTDYNNQCRDNFKYVEDLSGPSKFSLNSRVLESMIIATQTESFDQLVHLFKRLKG